MFILHLKEVNEEIVHNSSSAIIFLEIFKYLFLQEICFCREDKTIKQV